MLEIGEGRGRNPTFFACSDSLSLSVHVLPLQGEDDCSCSPHLPVASPQVGPQWQVCPDWPQLRTLPVCLGNLLHSILQETADKISIQRCRGGSGLLKRQARLWHLQHRWAGTLLEPVWYYSLETLASASFPAWNRPQGEAKNTLPVLPCCSQEYFLWKWQATWQGAALLRDCETALALKRKKVTYPLINWALQYGACKEALAASLSVVLEVWQLVENCAQIILNGLKARSQEEKHPGRGRRKNSPALSDQSLMLFLLCPQLSIPIMHRRHLQWLTEIRT